jgi:gamma-glutamylcyclotransferase
MLRPCSLYFAYGSNLCIRHMGTRCPDASPLGKFVLKDSKLVFRGVADCAYEPGAECHGGLWRITPECERSLDGYEGINSGFYRKEYVRLEDGEYEDTHLMFYVMNSTGIFPPAKHYLETIAQGYRDFRLPMDELKAAVAASWDQQKPTERERERHRRKGQPALAPRPRLDGEPDVQPATRYHSRIEVEPRQPRLWTDSDLTPPRNPTLQSWDDWQRKKKNSRRVTTAKDDPDLFDEWWEPGHSPLT